MNSVHTIYPLPQLKSRSIGLARSPGCRCGKLPRFGVSNSVTTAPSIILYLHSDPSLGSRARHDHEVSPHLVRPVLHDLADGTDCIDDRRTRLIRNEFGQRLDVVTAIRWCGMGEHTRVPRLKTRYRGFEHLNKPLIEQRRTRRRLCGHFRLCKRRIRGSGPLEGKMSSLLR